VCAELGRKDEARAHGRPSATAAESPLDRIEAFDELVLALVDAGDLEGAAGHAGALQDVRWPTWRYEETQLGGARAQRDRAHARRAATRGGASRGERRGW
jgi:hypothetical protein